MPLGIIDAPRPYPDELHFGYFGRLETYWLARSANALNRHLRGGTTGHASTDLLLCSEEQGHLLAALGIESGAFVWQHTLLPYYLGFRTSEERARIFGRLRAATLIGMHFLAGFSSSRVKRPRFFRYCRTCWRSENVDFGEVFVKRLFQLPGVLVCPEHSEPLYETSVLFRPVSSRAFWHFTPSDGTQKRTFEPDSESRTQLARFLALDARRVLLQGASTHPRAECLQADYHRALQHLGLASKNRHPLEFESAFLAMYPMDFLEKLGLGFEPGHEGNWLRRLVRKPERQPHPLEHILLRRFVEHHLGRECWPSMEAERWPCLSPLQPHPGKTEVEAVHLRYDSRRDAWNGTFQCACGFRYCGGGSGFPSSVGLLRHQVLAHSPYLRVRARALAQDGCSASAIAQQLKVDRTTVRAWLDHHVGQKAPRSPEAQEADRKAWLLLVKQHPEGMLKDLRKLAPSLFTRLYKQDGAWLQGAPPVRRHHHSQRHQGFWESRDQILSQEVAQRADEIRQREPPVRVTISRLGRELGLLNLFRTRLALLPSVGEVLARSVETVEAFQLRRLERALHDSLARRNRSALMRAAGLTHQSVRPCVAQAIDRLLSGEVTP
ncbi:TnsD family Tn7-like transposition protein [Aromatoleum toluclasticum]|uniref:TnsD family Tn7-like transposition protein n=1 Tax=Aromatoleum toluclasticum TaxID=92003 RepID=UPI0003A4115E|nr:TnsD family Tn7-like transposition protein [Aromatoleum toluclasticum]